MTRRIRFRRGEGEDHGRGREGPARGGEEGRGRGQGAQIRAHEVRAHRVRGPPQGAHGAPRRAQGLQGGDRQGADAQGHDRNTPRGRRDDDPQGEDDGGQVSPLGRRRPRETPSLLVPHITMHLTT